MVKEIKQGVLFTVVTMLLFGGGYHVVLWGIGQVVFPAQAEGSLIRRGDGTVVGSRLIAQKFTQAGVLPPAAVGGGLQRRVDRRQQLRAVESGSSEGRARAAGRGRWRRKASPPARCRRRW